ncbi:MAG: glycoside hydrolase family 20 zincin-like fold domain-containing protein, partial [Abditibacteriaceae bacterium]
LLQDVPADIEFNAGYFNANPLVNRQFSAVMRSANGATESTSNGVVPSFPAKDGLADLAPNFQTLNFDSRLGKMSIKVLSPNPVIFADARRYPSLHTEKTPMFWCGWLAGTQPLSMGHPVEMTVTIHIESPASQTPESISIHPATTSVPDAFVPNPQPLQPLEIVPKPKEITLNAAKNFALDDATKWSVTAPAGETRLTAAVGRLMSDEWNIKLPTPNVTESTSDGWCGIRLGDDKPIAFSSEMTNSDWAKHDDSYRLIVDNTGIQIVSPTARGAFYGVQTLAQMLRSDSSTVNAPFAEIEDWPTLQFRGAHWFPSKSGVPFDKKLIHIMARYKFNYAVIQCGFTRWDSHPEIAVTPSISKKDLQDLVNLCRANFIEPIPLLDGPGHAVWMFTNNQHHDLAEDPKTPYAYAVNNLKSMDFVHDIMSEIIDVFHPKIFHIGGDEVTMRGRFPNPDNSLNPQGETVSDLLSKNLIEQHDWLAKRGIKTMIWGDMFLSKKEGAYAANAHTIEEAQTRRAAIPKDVIVANWQYTDKVDYPSQDLFQKEGLKTIAAPWYSPLNVRNF